MGMPQGELGLNFGSPQLVGGHPHEKESVSIRSGQADCGGGISRSFGGGLGVGGSGYWESACFVCGAR